MAILESVAEATQDWAEKNQVSTAFAASVGSTNDMAKKMADNDPDALKLYLTEHQTGGRGRGEATWMDTGAGNYLLSSWSLLLNASPKHLTGPLVGLSLYRACRQTWSNLEWSLKAPNDLYLKDKKVGGLLVETVAQGQKYRLIVGLGFNITDHPSQVDHATHLTSEDGLGEPLHQDRWWQFLSHFHQALLAILPRCLSDQLDESSRDELLKALNANPHKMDVILEVTEAGDLVMDDKTIVWTEL